MAFNPKTEKINKLAKLYPQKIIELENLFDKPTGIYIDYGNIFHWLNKLVWRIDLKRLKQFIDSFDTIKKIKLYYGTKEGNINSENWIKDVKKLGYDVITKPVKTMRLSIDVRGIPINSPEVLKRFIKKELLENLKVGTVEYLNEELLELNKQGTFFIKHDKCNFDVEISVDMILDSKENNIENFILWSGDSDFADVIVKLKNEKKKICIFNIPRRVSPELSETKVFIFDIQKLKYFICWPREITEDIRKQLGNI